MAAAQGFVQEITEPILLILNPTAGRGAGGRLLPRIKSAAEKASVSLEIRVTTGPEDAGKWAAEWAGRGPGVVAVAGGDGTLSQVAAALAGQETAMAVIPTGTGNDLARHLGIPRDAELAVRALRSYRRVPLDLGEGNGVPFVLAAGCGFDAAVAQEVNRGVRWAGGALAYAAAALKTLCRYTPRSMRVQVDSVVHEFKGYFTATANACCYGGGMKIAPGASIRDGLLDVCCVGSLARLPFLLQAVRVLNGSHTRHPKVRMLQGRSILIEADPPALYALDGDVRGQTPLRIDVLPGALQLAFPDHLELPR